VVLNLEWEPHSGLDTFTLTLDGRAYASELRVLFWTYRQGSGSILLPSYPLGPLPEVICFDPAKYSCLYYKTGDNTGSIAANSLKYTSFFATSRPFGGCPAHHYCTIIDITNMEEMALKHK
jgi:hypothetical protein